MHLFDMPMRYIMVTRQYSTPQLQAILLRPPYFDGGPGGTGLAAAWEVAISRFDFAASTTTHREKLRTAGDGLARLGATR